MTGSTAPAHAGRTRSVKVTVLACAVIAVLLVAAAVLSIAAGAVPMSPGEVIGGLSGGASSFIVTSYRLPRVAVTILAGAALAVAGAFLQGAVRNPLASPDVVGLTKGAGLGAMVAITITPAAAHGWAIPVGVSLGAAVATAALLLIGRHVGGGVAGLALVGIAVGALAQAAMQYLMVDHPENADQAMVWLAGSAYGSTVADVAFLTAWLGVCLPAVVAATRSIDLAGFGDDSLTSLGGHPRGTRVLLVMVAVALTVGAVTSIGSMGFLGLLAPHLARLVVGSKGRFLVPTSALVGALVLCLADLAGRLVALPNEIPAGIVAAVIGGPYLLFLLLREARIRG